MELISQWGKYADRVIICSVNVLIMSQVEVLRSDRSLRAAQMANAQRLQTARRWPDDDVVSVPTCVPSAGPAGARRYLAFQEKVLRP
jgi:hypothetical protein